MSNRPGVPSGEPERRFPGPGRARRLSRFLGLQRSTAGVLVMVVLVGMGEHLAERFLPIYLIALGGGPAAHRPAAGDGQPALGPLLVPRRLPVRPLRGEAGAGGGQPGGHGGLRRGDLRPAVAGGPGRGGALHLLVVDLGPGHPQPHLHGAARREAHHGGEPALPGAAPSDGPRPGAGRGVHRSVGGAGRGAVRLRRRPGTGGRGSGAAAAAHHRRGRAGHGGVSAGEAVAPVGPDEPGAARPAGHRHPGALLRADPLRLRGGVVPEDHRRPGVGAAVRDADRHRDGDGDPGLHPGGLLRRPDRQEALRGGHLRLLHRLPPGAAATAARWGGWWWPSWSGA